MRLVLDGLGIIYYFIHCPSHKIKHKSSPHICTLLFNAHPPAPPPPLQAPPTTYTCPPPPIEAPPTTYPPLYAPPYMPLPLSPHMPQGGGHYGRQPCTQRLIIPGHVDVVTLSPRPTYVGTVCIRTTRVE